MYAKFPAQLFFLDLILVLVFSEVYILCAYMNKCNEVHARVQMAVQ
jgi:hypothetical protein